MSEELTCPDCGGEIGVEPGSGRQPCRCFEKRANVALATPRFSPEDRELSSPAPDAPADPDAKLCRVCGKDLRGRSRLKDSRGYICRKCNEAEERQAEIEASQDLDRIPCPECGRRLKVAGLTTVDGRVMCHQCAKDHKELNKFKTPPPALAVDTKAAEKQKLKVLLIVLGVLLLIMLLAGLGIIGSRG